MVIGSGKALVGGYDETGAALYPAPVRNGALLRPEIFAPYAGNVEKNIAYFLSEREEIRARFIKLKLCAPELGGRDKVHGVCYFANVLYALYAVFNLSGVWHNEPPRTVLLSRFKEIFRFFDYSPAQLVGQGFEFLYFAADIRLLSFKPVKKLRLDGFYILYRNL
jgi:hypothetical protein